MRTLGFCERIADIFKILFIALYMCKGGKIVPLDHIFKLAVNKKHFKMQAKNVKSNPN